ncbi:MAG: hypothetical protein U1D69_06550 [Polynucleobacter sp.]|nr:hypothetical protein [Polynucleobacter sp.]
MDSPCKLSIRFWPDVRAAWWEDLHETASSAGFFISFAEAWKAVKEFIETDGELPKSIEWLASEDIPPEAFPEN